MYVLYIFFMFAVCSGMGNNQMLKCLKSVCVKPSFVTVSEKSEEHELHGHNGLWVVL